MLGSPCSPCCTPAVPCISNQGTFLINIEITASDYFEQRTDVFGGRQFSGGPVIADFEVTRKTSTFFRGSLLNGTFVMDSRFQGFCTLNGQFSSCKNSNGITYFSSVSGLLSCCWTEGVNITIYNNPEPTNYQLKFSTPFVRSYREEIVLPSNTNNCQPPQYKDEQWFLAGSCCTNRFAGTLGCAETRESQMSNTVTGSCSGGTLTEDLPYTLTALPPAFSPDSSLWFLKSSTIDTQYGSLEVSVNSITLEPI